MDRTRLTELHYIAHVANVPSICARGILSHSRAAELEHTSVASPSVQSLREGKEVPGGLKLHEYANVYMTARNPMLNLLAVWNGKLDELCVFRVSESVLDIPDAVVSDMNAAAGWARFYPSPDGLAHVDGDRVFARFWTDGDALEKERCKKIKCAEVLIPHEIPADYLEGILVGSSIAKDAVGAHAPSLQVDESRDLFFQ